MVSTPQSSPSALSREDTLLLFPPIPLWDTQLQKPHTPVPHHEASALLSRHRNLEQYIGQDNPLLITHFWRTQVRRKDIEAWREELEKPSSERRLIVFYAKAGRILSPAESPTLLELPNFINSQRFTRELTRRLRLYSGPLTCPSGMGEKRLISLFLSHASVPSALPSRQQLVSQLPSSQPKCHWNLRERAAKPSWYSYSSNSSHSVSIHTASPLPLPSAPSPSAFSPSPSSASAPSPSTTSSSSASPSVTNIISSAAFARLYKDIFEPGSDDEQEMEDVAISFFAERKQSITEDSSTDNLSPSNSKHSDSEHECPVSKRRSESPPHTATGWRLHDDKVSETSLFENFPPDKPSLPDRPVGVTSAEVSSRTCSESHQQHISAVEEGLPNCSGSIPVSASVLEECYSISPKDGAEISSPACIERHQQAISVVREGYPSCSGSIPVSSPLIGESISDSPKDDAIPAVVCSPACTEGHQQHTSAVQEGPPSCSGSVPFSAPIIDESISASPKEGAVAVVSSSLVYTKSHQQHISAVEEGSLGFSESLPVSTPIVEKDISVFRKGGPDNLSSLSGLPGGQPSELCNSQEKQGNDNTVMPNVIDQRELSLLQETGLEETLSEQNERTGVVKVNEMIYSKHMEALDSKPSKPQVQDSTNQSSLGSRVIEVSNKENSVPMLSETEDRGETLKESRCIETIQSGDVVSVQNQHVENFRNSEMEQIDETLKESGCIETMQYEDVSLKNEHVKSFQDKATEEEGDTFKEGSGMEMKQSEDVVLVRSKHFEIFQDRASDAPSRQLEESGDLLACTTKITPLENVRPHNPVPQGNCHGNNVNIGCDIIDAGYECEGVHRDVECAVHPPRQTGDIVCSQTPPCGTRKNILSSALVPRDIESAVHRPEEIGEVSEDMSCSPTPHCSTQKNIASLENGDLRPCQEVPSKIALPPSASIMPISPNIPQPQEENVLGPSLENTTTNDVGIIPKYDMGASKPVSTMVSTPVSKPKSLIANAQPFPRGPSFFDPTQQDVYLWDYSEEKRSDSLVKISEAIKICKAEQSKTIYDGQDVDFEDDRIASLLKISKKDAVIWSTRQNALGLNTKIRVWNRFEWDLRKQRYSPSLHRLFIWFHLHPEYCIFSPSLLALPVKLSGRRNASVSQCAQENLRVRVCNALRQQVVRIRHLGVTELSDDHHRNILLWNVSKCVCEGPMHFSSRPELTRYLLANPWLEIFRGQHELLQFEKETFFKLIEVNSRCRAKKACFWDKNLLRIVSPVKDDKRIAEKSVLDCLLSDTDLELYIGQDLSQFCTVKNALLRLRKAGHCSNFYFLARCGEFVHKHIYEKGWLPRYVDPKVESTQSGVFWNNSLKSVVMQPLMGNPVSIEAYLRQTINDIVPYVGQDLEEGGKLQLNSWFNLLQCTPGYELEHRIQMLTKTSFLSLKNAAVRLTFSPESGLEGLDTTKVGRRTSNGHLTEEQPQCKRRKVYVESNQKVLDSSSGAPSQCDSDMKEAHLPNVGIDKHGLVSNTESDNLKEREMEDSLDTTNCSEDNHSDQSPKSSEVQEMAPEFEPEPELYPDPEPEPKPDTDFTSTCDTFDSKQELAKDSCHKMTGEMSEVMKGAKKAAKKMLCNIREAGPKVLKRELKHDLRQALREELILEVVSSNHLLDLVKEASSLAFVELAVDLCCMLEELDVHKCFMNTIDFGYGPPDLSAIREDLEGRKICTMVGVKERFQRICAELIQFHRENVLYYKEAMLLFYHGLRTISRFMSAHSSIVEKEAKIVRMAKICEQAKKIGFVCSGNGKKSGSRSRAKSSGIGELSLKETGGHPEVTFLNYRDEKGNSVMGKRHSVRVLGMSIDMDSPELRAGNFRHCHICREVLRRSDENCLTCANQDVGICEEVICRTCLESICSMDPSEFMEYQQSEKWFCVHCRGLCPYGSRCMKLERLGKMDWVGNKKRKVMFSWPYYSKQNTRVMDMRIIKRERNGEFASVETGRKVGLSRKIGENNWEAYIELCVGAYRCVVEEDGKMMAGSAFQVFPHAEKGQDGVIPAKKSSGESLKTVRRKPYIHWKVSKKERKGPVHAIRRDRSEDGGRLIKECSRTEGYDWRRSKRHAVLHWTPIVHAHDESSSENQDQDEVLLLSVDNKKKSVYEQWSKGPKSRNGLHYKELCTEWNTWKYDEMLQKTLWGIMTGRSNIHGIGLFTLTGYQKGDFVIEYAGDLIRTAVADLRESRYEAAGLGTYLFKINEDKIVDATVKSNRARFTNHSCDPNMRAQIIHIRGRDLVVLRATREITKYSELTFDYKLPYEDKKVQCLCNAWNCAGVMN